MNNALQQALSFAKQAPGQIKDFAQYSVINPIRRAMPDYQQQTKNANVYQQVVNARQLQAMGQIHNDPRNNAYTYSGGTPAQKPIINVGVQAQTRPNVTSQIIKQIVTRPKPTSTTVIFKPTATPTRMVTPTPSAAPVTATPTPTSFEALAIPIFEKYGIPLPVGFGMRDAEGGNIGTHNVYNIGAHDSRPTDAVGYESPEAGIEAYAKLLAGKYQLPNGQYDTRYANAYALRNDPEAMLQAIVQAGYAGDPKTWKQRSMSTGGAGKYYDSYDQFVKDTAGWKKHYKGKSSKK